MRGSLWILWTLALTACLDFVFAAEEPVQISAFVDKALATPSDEIALSVDLRLAKEYKDLELPDFAHRIDGLRIVSIAKDETKEIENAAVLKRRTLRLKADISGTYVIPAISIDYEDKVSAEKIHKETSDIFIEIKAPETADKNDGKEGAESEEKQGLIDIKDMEKKPLNYWLLLALALVLVLFICIVLMLLRRKKTAPLAPPIPPHEWAFQELGKLQANPENSEENRIFYFRLSEIIRTYLEECFHFPATDQTLEETCRSLGTSDTLDSGLKNAIKDVLTQADLVKFAKVSTDATRNEKMLSLSIEIVEKTKPQEESAEKEEREAVI